MITYPYCEISLEAKLKVSNLSSPVRFRYLASPHGTKKSLELYGMALSQNTLDNLLEAESHIRAAIKSAAVNEKPMVVKQLSDILISMEQCKKFDELMDMISNACELEGNRQFGSFFSDED